MPKGIPIPDWKKEKIEKMIRDGYTWAIIQIRYNVSFGTYCKIKRGMRKKEVQ